MEYESVNAAARELGLHKGGVSACCNGKTKRVGKFPEYEFELAPLAEDQENRPGEVWRDVQPADAESGASVERPAVQSTSAKGRGESARANSVMLVEALVRLHTLPPICNKYKVYLSPIPYRGERPRS